MKPKFWTILSLLVILSTMVACVAPAAMPAPAQPAAQAPEATKAPAAAAPAESWWATAAKNAGCVGKTIRGVAESTPPSKFAADPIAKEFAKETGINVEFETTSWDQMYDKAIKDMEADTGIYDFVYIEQDIIYAYLANNFLVNLTQMLKDKPKLAFADFDLAKFTSFINYFKDPKTGDVYRRADGGLHQALPLPQGSLRRSGRSRPPSRRNTAMTWRRPRPTQQYQDIADFFTQWGKDNNMELWGTTVQGNTGPRLLLLRICRDDCAQLRRLQLGHQHGQLEGVRRERRPDEQRQGQGSADVLGRPAQVCPARGHQQHLGRGRGHLRCRPCGPGLGLRREHRLDRHRSDPAPRSSARSAWRCRRPSRA